MEPDHSANIKHFLDAYPKTIVVGNDKTFNFMENFFGNDIAKNRLVVIVSHNLSDARTFADRIIELSNGKIINDYIRNKDYTRKEENEKNIGDK